MTQNQLTFWKTQKEIEVAQNELALKRRQQEETERKNRQEEFLKNRENFAKYGRNRYTDATNPDLYRTVTAQQTTFEDFDWLMGFISKFLGGKK